MVFYIMRAHVSHARDHSPRHRPQSAVPRSLARAEIAASGFKTIVANRPDGEGGVDQPRMGAIRAKAESLGLTFVALPFSGAPTPEVVERMSNILNEAPQPVLAYCRTGTRCITAWALTHAGQGTGQEIVDAAACGAEQRKFCEGVDGPEDAMV